MSADDQIAEQVRSLLRAGAALGVQARTAVGLGPTDLAALQALDSLAGRPQPMGWLSQELGLSTPATTELVDRLLQTAAAPRR